MRILICAATSIGVCAEMLAPNIAYAIDLTGAWASDASQCTNVFTKEGPNPSFKQDSDMYGSGLIIEGNQIRGRMAKCEIKSRKEVGETLQLIAVCVTDIMFSNQQFSLKVINDNQIVRIFTDIPDMQLPYSRCTL
jgi:hypothetical protein